MRKTLITAIGLAIFISNSQAEESDLVDWLTGDYLLGTWDGQRAELAERGVDLELFYFGTVPTNINGGIDTGTNFQGALLATATLDSEKLIGYKGGTFHISGIWLQGQEGFSEERIGDLNRPNLVDFPNQLRLWELWYSQKFLDDKITLKAGILSVDRDFIVPEYYNSLSSINFLNQTFFFPTLAFNLTQIPGFPETNRSLPSTPFGSLGILLRAEPTDNWYVQAAVYEGSPDDGSSGTNISIDDDEGLLIYAETGFKWGRNTGLPGSLKIGGFYHTDEFTDITEGVESILVNAFGLDAETPKDRSGNYGGYLLAEQFLWLEEGHDDPAMQGALAFFRFAIAPKDRNLTQLGIDGGLVFKGLIPGRDWDTIGLGVSYLEISDDIQETIENANSTFGTDFRVPDFEGLVELSYKAQITAWWTLQPSVQWVINPGGGTNLANQPSDATAFVLQTTLRF